MFQVNRYQLCSVLTLVCKLRKRVTKCELEHCGISGIPFCHLTKIAKETTYFEATTSKKPTLTDLLTTNNLGGPVAFRPYGHVRRVHRRRHRFRLAGLDATKTSGHHSQEEALDTKSCPTVHLSPFSQRCITEKGPYTTQHYNCSSAATLTLSSRQSLSFHPHLPPHVALHSTSPPPPLSSSQNAPYPLFLYSLHPSLLEISLPLYFSFLSLFMTFAD